MSFDLEPEYGNWIEQQMADLASSISILDPDTYQDNSEGLFAALVRGVYIYVDAWIRSGAAEGSLAGMLVATDDLNDPSRADDPTASFFSFMDLALEAIRDNIGVELDPNYGRA